MKKKTKIILFSIIGGILTISLVIAIPFIVMGVKTNNLNKDYSYLKQDATYSQKVALFCTLPGPQVQVVQVFSE